jgi:hypothetical protein
LERAFSPRNMALLAEPNLDAALSASSSDEIHRSAAKQVFEHSDRVAVGVKDVVVGQPLFASAFEDDRIHGIKLS